MLCFVRCNSDGMEGDVRMSPEQLLQEAGKYQDKIRSERRYLHQHPETGFGLKRNKSICKERITGHGI